MNQNNNRIREDTAKYLRNLDTNSAFYDPKTRSMRDNPTQSKDPTEVIELLLLFNFIIFFFFQKNEILKFISLK